MKLPIEELKHEPIEESFLKITDLDNTECKVNLENRDSVIKYIEKIVRNSFEYRELINFLKQEMNLSHCLLLTNVDYTDATINFHHDPLRMYEVCDIILNKHEVLYTEINIYKICEEVMLVHYAGMIPLVPVTYTIHELIHSDSLFIPIQLIEQGGFGKYRNFYNEYKDYMSDNYKKLLREYITTSNEIIDDYQLPILKRKFTYIRCDNIMLPKRFVSNMKDH